VPAPGAGGELPMALCAGCVAIFNLTFVPRISDFHCRRPKKCQIKNAARREARLTDPVLGGHVVW